MKLQLKAISIALGAATLLVGSAWGDAQISTGATSPLDAKANVTLRVTIPRVIALRIGEATLANTISITQGAVGGNWGTDPLDPTVAALFGLASSINDANGSNTTAGNNLKMWTWTNISGGGAISCAVTPGGSPILSADLHAVSVGAGVGHPAGGNLNAQCGAPSVTFMPVGSIKTDTWEYSFIGLPSSYVAGTYTSAVKYTASAI